MRSEINFILSRSVKAYIALLKILLPVTILVKVLDEIGFISILGGWLSPVMSLVGLPGEMAFIWATGMISGPYAAIFAYTAIAKSVPINIAQVTTFATMLLFAHSMVIETTIGKKIGVSIWYQIILRIFSAFIIGILLNQIYLRLNVLTDIAPSLWASEESSTSIATWIVVTIKNFAMTFVIMTGLIALLRAMEKFHLLEYLYKIAEPMLNFFGMSKETAPIAIIGFTLGVSVGGGLIIDEAQNGKLSRKDTFLVFSMMCLVHSVIEDTIIMSTIGADLSGQLLIRLIFAFALFFLISRSKGLQRFYSLDVIDPPGAI